MQYLVVFFISLIFTITFTPPLIRFLIEHKIIDKPDERKIHKQLIPRMGGIIIFFVVTFLLLIFYHDLNSIRFLFLAALITISCGILDDIINIRWKAKFVLQSLAAFLIVLHFANQVSSLTFFGFIIPAPLNYVLLFFFVVGVLNAVNLMDGLDGLVNGYSFLIFSILSAHAYLMHDKLLLILSVSVMGATLGFMKFNSYPARIFLGDSGSLILGFFLIIASLHTSTIYNKPALDLTYAFILLGVPVVDTLKVLCCRIINGKNPFLPDKSHFHHIIFLGNVRHKTTVFLIQSFSLLFCLIALLYLQKHYLPAIILFLLLSSVIFFIKPIVVEIGKIMLLKKYYDKAVASFPNVFITFYKNVILPLSFIAIVYVCFFNFNFLPELLFIELVPFIIGLLVLFTLALKRSTKESGLNPIYVFLNLLLFFIMKTFYAEEQVFTNSMIKYSYYASIIVIAAVVIIYMVTRERITAEKLPFLNGIDLTLIVFIIMINSLNMILFNNKIEVLSINLILAFLIYLWYRVVSTFKKELSKIIFFSSFATNIIIIGFLIYKTI